jgi:hypothetical protein
MTFVPDAKPNFKATTIALGVLETVEYAQREEEFIAQDCNIITHYLYSTNPS